MFISSFQSPWVLQYLRNIYIHDIHMFFSLHRRICFLCVPLLLPTRHPSLWAQDWPCNSICHRSNAPQGEKQRSTITWWNIPTFGVYEKTRLHYDYIMITWWLHCDYIVIIWIIYVCISSHFDEFLGFPLLFLLDKVSSKLHWQQELSLTTWHCKMLTL